MGEAGVFEEDDRVELLEGQIVEMTPIGSEHAGRVNRLNSLLHSKIGDEALISVRNPLQLGDFSEPEPDLAVLEPRPDSYTSRHPAAQDALLVIEVAETSAEDDRSPKVPLYADHSVPVVWLVDLSERTVEVYSNPADGEYGDVELASNDDILRPETIPSLDLTPAQIFR